MNNEIRCHVCGHDNSITISLLPDPIEFDEWERTASPSTLDSYFWCDRCYEDRLNLLRDPW